MKKRCEKSLTAHISSLAKHYVYAASTMNSLISLYGVLQISQLSQEDEMEEESQFSGSNSEVDDEMDMDAYDA
jgi:hypothetical protein